MKTLSPSGVSGRAHKRHLSGRQGYVLLVLLLGLATFGVSAWTWNALQPRQTFLVAAERLPPDTVLTPADLTTVQADPAAVPAGALQHAADAIGQTVAETLEQGDYVTAAHLSNAPGRVATGLRPDQRLITIPTNGATALVEGLQPGDRFDLLLSFPASGAGLSGALVEGLVVRSISGDGAFAVVVPLPVAAFIAQTEAGGKLAMLASPQAEQALGVPTLLTGQICQIFLAPDGALMPAASLPAGAILCPGIYPTPATGATSAAPALS